jgi:tetratricopeptide (TPR) repeat protein
MSEEGSRLDAGARHAHAELELAKRLYGKGREDEAEAACRRAIAEGLDGAAPQLFLARLFQDQARFDEAEAALRNVIRQDPSSPQAQRELAQLIWMRTGDLIQARAELDLAPPTPMITSITVKLLQGTGCQRLEGPSRRRHAPSPGAIPIAPGPSAGCGHGAVLRRSS